MKITENTLDRRARTAVMPRQDAPIAERIRYLISRLRKTQAQFGELIDVDPANMSKMMKGHIHITDRVINRIVVNLGVNRQWLVSGEGTPFAVEADTTPTLPMTELGRKGAPVYDIDVTAGRLEWSRMFTQEHVVGYVDMPAVNTDDPVVRVSGLSMAPRVPNGAYVQIHEVNVAGPINWGGIYVVVLEDYRMVKVVRKHPTDPSLVILHSYNPEFDDMEVYRLDIKRLFHVTAILNYDVIA